MAAQANLHRAQRYQHTATKTTECAGVAHWGSCACVFSTHTSYNHSSPYPLLTRRQQPKQPFACSISGFPRRGQQSSRRPPRSAHLNRRPLPIIEPYYECLGAQATARKRARPTRAATRSSYGTKKAPPYYQAPCETGRPFTLRGKGSQETGYARRARCKQHGHVR